MPRRSARLAAKPRRNYRAMAGLRPNKKKVAKLAPSVKRAVNMLINKKQDTKFKSTGSWDAAPYGDSSPFGIYFNSSIASSSEMYPLIPPINQGVQEDQRLGDSIRPVSLIVRCLVSANGSYQSSQLSRVRLFIVSSKAIKNQDIQSDLDVNTLLDNGGNQFIYSGKPADHLAPLNRDSWVGHVDKKFDVFKGIGTTPMITNTFEGTQVFMANQQSHEFTFRIPVPKKLTYGTEASLVPENCAVWFCLGYTQPDGNTQSDDAVQRINCSWNSTLYYKDA